jgi:hypothetical protein
VIGLTVAPRIALAVAALLSPECLGGRNTVGVADLDKSLVQVRRHPGRRAAQIRSAPVSPADCEKESGRSDPCSSGFQ